ncbi:glycosyltransferase family 2 protein [Nocardioides glacieisoli]|uniref:glycosyltransferase family 2 protein n=1 Tax=Nocardioides glacieisoli TaxID=1168730 RepID=UPI0013EA044B|nr:glycosyltransferase family 2 protein [Nocardioides glacieisoli]
MSAPVDVSVVIVSWNTRDLLLEVVDSLRSTTHRTSYEVIVVDNASSDGSVEALTERHPDVTVIVNPDNYGFARANNIGFAVARGAAYCLVNTDVVAHDGVIDELWSYLEQHPGVGAVAPMTLHADGRVRANVRRFPDLRNALGDHLWLKRLLPSVFPGRSTPLDTLRSTHSAEVLSGCFLMVRRGAVDEVGPLDEGFFFYGEDTDWARRLRDGGWDCVYHPAATATHLGGGSTAAHPVTYYLAMEKSDLRYWNKHQSPRARDAYVAIRLLHNLASIAVWALVWVGRPRQRDRAGLKVRGNARNTGWLLTHLERG